MLIKSTLVLLGLAGLLLAPPAAAQTGACGVGAFNFFPAGTTNTPQAWTQTNQSLAGNTATDTLLPIALYGVPQPKLSFQLMHWAVTMGCGIPASASRRLQQAAAATVTTPAAYTIKYQIDKGAVVTAATNGQGAATFSVYGSPDMTSGLHTLTITATIAARSGVMSDGSRVPTQDTTVSKVVTFYKLTTPYSDVVGANKVTVSTGYNVTFAIANLFPLPVTVGTSYLVRPVVHVWGQMVQDLEGNPYIGGEDPTDSTQVHFFDGYLIRNTDSANNVSIASTNLADGYYEVNVETSITSDLPSLLSLAGYDTFKQTEVSFQAVSPDGMPTDAGAIALTGQPKFNGYLNPKFNKTLVCLHTTVLNSFAGPITSIKVNESITFTWDFTGTGTTTCTLDGKAYVTDTITGLCSTPQSGSVDVLVADGTRHTLSVTFKDVCNGTMTESFFYQAGQGYNTTATCDACSPAGGSGIKTTGAPMLTGLGNGASMAGGAGLMHLALAAAVAALIGRWL